MLSMTGYGKAEYKKRKLSVSVEMSSVNSRYLEFVFRLPKQITFLEPGLRELISSRISRGKITVSVNYLDLGSGLEKLVVNESLANEIHSRLAALKKKYKLAGEIEVAHFLSVPEIFNVEKDVDIENVVWPIVKTATNRALKELVKMRRTEGGNLKKDLIQRLNQLERQIRKIEKLAPTNVSIYREKLEKKIRDVLIDNTINGNRLEEEVAYMAERADITEECVRFTSHLKQFRETIELGGSIGKRLNFLLQELNREANTVGAKAAGTEIPKIVLNLKEEIEKMREQVQNVE